MGRPFLQGLIGNSYTAQPPIVFGAAQLALAKRARYWPPWRGDAGIEYRLGGDDTGESPASSRGGLVNTAYCEPPPGRLERDRQADPGHAHDRGEVARSDQIRRRAVRDLLPDRQLRRQHRRVLGRHDALGEGDASRRQGALRPPHLERRPVLLRGETGARHHTQTRLRRLGRAGTAAKVAGPPAPEPSETR